LDKVIAAQGKEKLHADGPLSIAWAINDGVAKCVEVVAEGFIDGCTATTAAATAAATTATAATAATGRGGAAGEYKSGKESGFHLAHEDVL
jgi:hypothetical protein